MNLLTLLLALLPVFIATAASQRPGPLVSEQASLALEHVQRGIFGDIVSGIGDLFGGPDEPIRSSTTATPTSSKTGARTNTSQELDSESNRPTGTPNSETKQSLIGEDQSTGGGLPSSTKIAMGVAIPSGLILISIVVVLFVKLRANKKAQEKYDRQPSIEISEARDELLVTIGGAGEVEEYAPPSYTELPEKNRPENNKK
ncbi:hypothetical protein GGH92_004561 [Coemansia sp. RSA 2673]|nr:hypothetical protein GGH13_008139 [Coemansia sp. S155-1]KAJ2344266.1 hypothetical protein GGH92_004561 [Coemansia sp. RSA 2673]